MVAIYPLKQVIEVKQRRVDEAEKVVKEKEAALQKEKDILVEKEKERDKVKQHYADKLAQLRHEMDVSTTSPKIQQMKVYLNVAKEKIVIEEKKVEDQKKQVEAAEKNLENAKNELKIKRQEVDKLMTHRKDWIKEMRKEEEIVEARDQDEMGSIIFTTHHQKKR